MGSHHNVQVVPLEASYVLVPWAPPGILTVLFTLTDLGDTEDHKSSLWEVEDSLILSLWESILQKKKKKQHISLCFNHYFFFHIQFFQHSLKAAGIMKNKYVLFQMWCRLYWTTLWKKGLQRFICGSRSSTISVRLNSSCDWNHPDCYHLCCSPLYYKVSISGILQ